MESLFFAFKVDNSEDFLHRHPTNTLAMNGVHELNEKTLLLLCGGGQCLTKNYRFLRKK